MGGRRPSWPSQPRLQRSRPRGRAGLEEPRRLRPPHRPARRPRRLGDRDQLAVGDLREASRRPGWLPPRGLPRRRARHPDPDQAPRRLVLEPPQARRQRGPAGRPARRRLPAPHRPRRPGSRRPPHGEHPPLHGGPVHEPRPDGRTTHAERRRRPLPHRGGARRLHHRVRRRARFGQDHAALLLRGGARPKPPRRRGRGGVRDRRPAPERGLDADPGRPPRPPRGRPASPRRRLPPHGPGRGDRGRGPRPGGAPPPADPVVGGQGVHHDPRRQRTRGAVPDPLPRRALGVGPQPPPLGADDARRRGGRPRGPQPTHRRGSRGDRDPGGRGPRHRPRDRRLHRHRGVRPQRPPRRAALVG